MTDEDQNHEEVSEYGSFSFKKLNRILAILFVLGIYAIIFLKILVLE